LTGPPGRVLLSAQTCDPHIPEGDEVTQPALPNQKQKSVIGKSFYFAMQWDDPTADRRGVGIWIGLIFALVILFSVGCSKKSTLPVELENSFNAMVPVSSMNQDIRIFPDSSSGSFKSNAIIRVAIENISDHAILVPLSTSVKMYIVENNIWKQVTDRVEYFGRNGEGSVLNAKKLNGISTYRVSTSVGPVIAESTFGGADKILLRITVTGTVLDTSGNKTDQTVGGYTDVYIER
jgi:hypothetical protein